MRDVVQRDRERRERERREESLPSPPLADPTGGSRESLARCRHCLKTALLVKSCGRRPADEHNRGVTDTVGRGRAPAPHPGRGGVPPLRRPLREGRLPGRVPPDGVPVRLRVRGLGPHVRRAACRRSTTSRSISTCSKRPRPDAAASVPCAPAARRFRCARSRSSGRTRTARTSSAAAIPEFHELPRERANFRVFATVDWPRRARRAPQRRLAAPVERAHAVEVLGRLALVLPRLGDRGECLRTPDGRGTSRARPPMRPSPTSSCRSRFEPSGVWESFTCRTRSAVEPDARVEVCERSVESVCGPRRRRPTPTSGTSRGRGRAAGAGRPRPQSAASSAIERPIVPPAPAAFSMHSQRSSVVSSRSSRSAGATQRRRPRRTRARGASRRGRRPPRRRSRRRSASSRGAPRASSRARPRSRLARLTR